jgi:lysophospholipase L1-like esterase
MNALRRDSQARARGRSLARLLLVLGLLVLLIWRVRERASSGRVAWQRPSRVSQLERLPLDGASTVMLGASLVEHGEWSEWLPARAVRNRGVAGDTVDDVLHRLDAVIRAAPREVYVMVGLNDLFAGREPVDVLLKHGELVRRLREHSPDTRVVLMSLLPVRRDDDDELNAAIAAVNAGLLELAKVSDCEWLDLTEAVVDANGRLRDELTLDGVHLNGAGYAAWAARLTSFDEPR